MKVALVITEEMVERARENIRNKVLSRGENCVFALAFNEQLGIECFVGQSLVSTSLHAGGDPLFDLPDEIISKIRAFDFDHPASELTGVYPLDMPEEYCRK